MELIIQYYISFLSVYSTVFASFS